MVTCEDHDGCIVVYDYANSNCPLCDAYEKIEFLEFRIEELEGDIDDLKTKINETEKKDVVN